MPDYMCNKPCLGLIFSFGATSTERDWSTTHPTRDLETPGRMGGGSPPDAGEGDSLHMRSVPIHIPLRRVGGARGAELSKPYSLAQTFYVRVVDHGV